MGLPVQAHAALFAAADDMGKPVELHIQGQLPVDVNPKPLVVAIAP